MVVGGGCWWLLVVVGGGECFRVIVHYILGGCG